MITKHTHTHNCSPLLVALSSQPGCAKKSDKWSSAHAHTPWQPRRISTDIHSAKVSLQRLVALSITGFSYLFFCIAHCLRICYCKIPLKLSLQKTGELNARHKQWLAPPVTSLNYTLHRLWLHFWNNLHLLECLQWQLQALEQLLLADTTCLGAVMQEQQQVSH